MGVQERAAVLAVLGAGSWGTALATHLVSQGHRVRLWGHVPEHIRALREAGENREFLPGIPLPPGLTPTDDLRAALDGIDDVLMAVPSHAFHAVLKQCGPLPGQRLAWATKGLEYRSGRFLHEVVQEVYPGMEAMAVLSGPTFAGEVARGLPTALTVAADDPGFAVRWAAYLNGPRFRAYTSDDLIGVQLGGAVKNVLAVAAGIADGLGFGANSRAALITRGLAEMMRLGRVLGGRAETFMGLTGQGDLVLTCTDDQSRNRRLGLLLGRGWTLDAARNAIGQVTEGVPAAAEVHALAQRVGVEMPICRATYAVLYEDLKPMDAVQRLFAREIRSEFD